MRLEHSKYRAHRQTYYADLTATLRDEEDGYPEGDSLGVAYTGYMETAFWESVTRYSLFQPGQPFDTSFVLHELDITSVRGTIGANTLLRRRLRADQFTTLTLMPMACVLGT